MALIVLLTAAVGLARDSVSEAIRLDDGWHIIKLIDTTATHTRMRRAYLAELLKRNPPVLNELALSNLLDSSRK